MGGLCGRTAYRQRDEKLLELCRRFSGCNTFLTCLCKKNLKSNPSGLFPEALNVMMEMRTYKIAPTMISYNIFLSCLGRTRRVKEYLRILDATRNAGCSPHSPHCVTYYLVARVLYLTGRFGKCKQIVVKMVEEGIVPECRFYDNLIGILCGVERANYDLELMKKSSLGDYGPVYDLLIPKVCRGGDFERGRELWNEAAAMGVVLQCSSELLDPAITEVFNEACGGES